MKRKWFPRLIIISGFVTLAGAVASFVVLLINDLGVDGLLLWPIMILFCLSTGLYFVLREEVSKDRHQEIMSLMTSPSRPTAGFPNGEEATVAAEAKADCTKDDHDYADCDAE